MVIYFFSSLTCESKKPVQLRPFKFCSLTPQNTKEEAHWKTWERTKCTLSGTIVWRVSLMMIIELTVTQMETNRHFMSISVVQMWVWRLYIWKMEDISTKKREIVDIVVNEKYIFEMDRYYRIKKTKSQLRRTICRIKNICQPTYEPYFCVVYSLNDDADHVKDIEIPRHGNSKKNTDRKTLHLNRNDHFKTSR